METEAATDDEKAGYLVLIKCQNVMAQLRKRGSPVKMTYKEALGRFSSPSAKLILANIRRGHYVGLRQNGKIQDCFMIANRNTDGDISWLFKKYPTLESSINEVYLVLETSRPRVK